MKLMMRLKLETKMKVKTVVCKKCGHYCVVIDQRDKEECKCGNVKLEGYKLICDNNEYLILEENR